MTKLEFLKKIKEICPHADIFENGYKEIIIRTNMKEEIRGEADDAETFVVALKEKNSF